MRYNHLPDSLYQIASAKTTLTREQLRNTLLATNGKVIAAGRLRTIKSKHIGAGIYEVWLGVSNG